MLTQVIYLNLSLIHPWCAKNHLKTKKNWYNWFNNNITTALVITQTETSNPNHFRVQKDGIKVNSVNLMRWRRNQDTHGKCWANIVITVSKYLYSFFFIIQNPIWAFWNLEVQPMQLYKCDGKQISHYRKILIKAYIVYHHTSIFMFKSTLLPRSLKFESCNSYILLLKVFYSSFWDVFKSRNHRGGFRSRHLWLVTYQNLAKFQ